MSLVHSLASLTSSTSNSSLSGSVLLILLAITAVVVIFEIAAFWKIFKKAGRHGWAALIPIYNVWVLFEISGKPGWWALASLLTFIPVVGGLLFLVLTIIAYLELARRFGRGQVFAIVGLVLFGVVGFPILGFGDAQYQVDAVADTNTPPSPPVTSPTPSTAG